LFLCPTVCVTCGLKLRATVAGNCCLSFEHRTGPVRPWVRTRQMTAARASVLSSVLAVVTHRRDDRALCRRRAVRAKTAAAEEWLRMRAAGCPSAPVTAPSRDTRGVGGLSVDAGQLAPIVGRNRSGDGLGPLVNGWRCTRRTRGWGRQHPRDRSPCVSPRAPAHTHRRRICSWPRADERGATTMTQSTMIAGVAAIERSGRGDGQGRFGTPAPGAYSLCLSGVRGERASEV
jgi:hypothetical protein